MIRLNDRMLLTAFDILFSMVSSIIVLITLLLESFNEHNIIGALFTLSFSLLILNSQFKDGASDVNVDAGNFFYGNAASLVATRIGHNISEMTQKSLLSLRISHRHHCGTRMILIFQSSIQYHVDFLNSRSKCDNEFDKDQHVL